MIARIGSRSGSRSMNCRWKRIAFGFLTPCQQSGMAGNPGKIQSCILQLPTHDKEAPRPLEGSGAGLAGEKPVRKALKTCDLSLKAPAKCYKYEGEGTRKEGVGCGLGDDRHRHICRACSSTRIYKKFYRSKAVIEVTKRING